jgi:hypothetical protein
MLEVVVVKRRSLAGPTPPRTGTAVSGARGIIIEYRPWEKTTEGAAAPPLNLRNTRILSHECHSKITN